MRPVLLCLLLTACGCPEDSSIPLDAAYDIPPIDVPFPDAGPIASGCEARARWVYLVDSNRQLIRFEPDSETFTTVGTLNCDPTSQPFSMAVDRDAGAWVLYQNGRLYRASTVDASCTPTTFAPSQQGLDLFGMGFVGVGTDRENEQLFIAGGPEGTIANGASRLATINTTSLTVTPLGNELPGWPELTGTAEGDLWGFFPDTSPPSVSRLDKTTGAPVQTINLNTSSGSPRAWAFAFWGGSYYVFLQTSADPSTNVYRVDPVSGESELLIQNSGQRIVGAGVSICAPLELI